MMPRHMIEKPPVAVQKPFTVTSPHGDRSDPYYWLRDDKRENQEMLAYLREENAWFEQHMAPQAGLVETLYGEIIGRIKQEDSSVPYFDRGYFYSTRFEEGKEYPIYVRRKGDLAAPEEILLDGNVLAQGLDFFQIGNFEVSDDGQQLAYLVDAVGRRQFELHIVDLARGTAHAEVILGLSTSLAWAADSRTLFYVENDPETLLSTRVKRHVVGTDAKADVLVYQETDPSFYLGVARTGDHAYVCIASSSTVSDETRFLPASNPTAEPKVLVPRERGHEYDADHIGGAGEAGRWILRSNLEAKNFRIVALHDGEEGNKASFREVIAHRDDTFLEGFTLLADVLAIGERGDGLRRIRVHEWQSKAERHIGADEPAYVAALATNANQASEWLRYTYSSPTTPATTYELNVRSGERKLLKREPVLGDFAPESYRTERVWAEARDGTKIPVSLLYRKDFVKDGSAKLFQYAYGSYGLSMDPAFSSPRLSLVDRGVVYAIAHIRGGQEMGRAWYESGKLLQKQNTFHDFIDVTRHLVKHGYAAADSVAAMGGSAGGLLMGAVANMAPSEYRALVAAVPFVDVVTTMLDESIPLTTNEFDEWGNPKDKAFYDAMLAYSPYDNVTAQSYPAILITTGLWDSQVQYWEPAKWVAKLRTKNTGSHPLLFKTNLEAGHGGKSGRFQRYREVAEEYAFVLTELGV